MTINIFANRIGKLCETSNRPDGFLLTEPSNVLYFTGYWTILSGQSPCAAIIIPGGQIALVFPALEEPCLQDIGAEADIIVPWRNYPLEVGGILIKPKTFENAVIEALVLCGLSKGACLGTDSMEIDRLLLDQYNYLIIREEIGSIRMVKESDELEMLKKSSEICARAIDAARKNLRVGVAETEVAAAVAEAVYSSGCYLSHLVIGSGPRSALCHPVPTNRILGPNEPLLIDIGVYYGGYWTEIARTFVLEPQDEWIERYELVKSAQDAGRKALRANAKACDVDQAMRQVFLSAGYDGRFFTHSGGHGCGLLGADGPSIGPGSTNNLLVPSVWSLEPAIYFSGSGGVRLEDAFVLTNEGPDYAFPYPQILWG